MKAKATPAVSAALPSSEPVPTRRRRPAKRVPLFPKGSAMAKSPLGKLAELLRDVSADKIKPWPLSPCPCCGR